LGNREYIWRNYEVSPEVGEGIRDYIKTSFQIAGEKIADPEQAALGFMPGVIHGVNPQEARAIRGVISAEQRVRGSRYKNFGDIGDPVETVREVVDEVARGQWYHGRSTYPKSGETFALARRKTGNLGEPEGLSLTGQKELLSDSFAGVGLSMTPEQHSNYKALFDKWYDAVETKQWDVADAIAPELKKLLGAHPAIARPESIQVFPERTFESMYPPFARVFPKFGGKPEQKILPGWKGPGTEWAQDIIKKAYVEAIPEEVIENIRKMSGPANREYIQALSGLKYYNERLAEKYPGLLINNKFLPSENLKKILPEELQALEKLEEKVDKLGGKIWDNARYNSEIRHELERYGREKFNKAFTANLEKQGYKGMLYSPERFGEFELRMFNPDDVLMLDMRIQEDLALRRMQQRGDWIRSSSERAPISKQFQQRPHPTPEQAAERKLRGGSQGRRLERWSKEASGRYGSKLGHIYEDIDWADYFHKLDLKDLERRTLLQRYGIEQ